MLWKKLNKIRSKIKTIKIKYKSWKKSVFVSQELVWLIPLIVVETLKNRIKSDNWSRVSISHVFKLQVEKFSYYKIFLSKK